MATYLLSYDLNQDKDYPRLWDELKKFNARQVLYSEWVFQRINTNSDGLLRHFRQFVDANDSLLVVDMTLDKAGVNLRSRIDDM
jgi:hypothetical protein